MPRVRLELEGQRFTNLVVLKRVKNSFDNKYRWLCRCDCGTLKKVTASQLVNGGTKSCGCLKKERIRRLKWKHGDAPEGKKAPEYWVWQAMKKRCSEKARGSDKKLYFDRGIRVCNRWKTSYINFISDMGKRPGKDYSIDRINNNKGYGPNNCKWSTLSEQMKNRRPFKRKRNV